MAKTLTFTPTATYVGKKTRTDNNGFLYQAQAPGDMTLWTEQASRIGATGSSSNAVCYAESLFFNASADGVPLSLCRGHQTSVSIAVTSSGVSYHPTLYYGAKKNTTPTNFSYDNDQEWDAEAWRTAGTRSTLTLGNAIPESLAYVFGGFDKITYCALSNPVLTVVVADYTITYHPNEGTGAPSAQTVSISADGYKATLSSTAPTRDGYTFKGWATTAGSAAAYQPGESITISGDTTLYAVWELLTYTVTYNKGANGTGDNATATKTHGTALTLEGALFARTGYTQTGWATSDGGAKAYDLGGSYTTDAAVTLYPAWTANTYTVTFDANGGEVTTGSKTVTYDDTYGELPTPTRAGYRFDGWHTDPDGGEQVLESTPVSITDAQTLYAHWTVQSIVHVMDAAGTLHDGILYVTDAAGTLHVGIVYAADADGALHVNG